MDLAINLIIAVIATFSGYFISRRKHTWHSIDPSMKISLFNAQGNNILRNSSFISRKDLMDNFLAHCRELKASSQIRDLIYKMKSGEVIVCIEDNTLDAEVSWWLVRTIAVNDLLWVIMIQINSQMNSYSALKASYNRLEELVDNGPFGLFYGDQQKRFLGLNNTLAKWLDRNKNEILGHNLDEFLTFGRVPQLVTINDKEFLRLNYDAHSSLLCPLQGLRLQTEDHILDSVIPAIIINHEHQIISTNDSFLNLCKEFTNNMTLGDIFVPNLRFDYINKIRRGMENNHPLEVCLGQEQIHVTTYISKLKSCNLYLLQFIDISEQKKLEQQFIQSQKMQAVGQLAGGIAHDFNNLLTAMLGFCDLLLQRYTPSDPSYADVMQIKQNASRAANLVRQLLAFSRQQNLQPRVVDITDTIEELSALLRRLLGVNIKLDFLHERELWLVRVDPSQLEQVIINLAVNARDAMDNGGSLTIKTNNKSVLSALNIGHEIVPAGEYVLIQVIDTGSGINKVNIDHIFEPFFSTKEVGAGTGLGLSTVYGIVKQTGGFITVESMLNTGTTFSIYLPKHTGSKQIVRNKSLPKDLTGEGNILLVEDEDAVRMFSARALKEKGYQVVEASNGEQALEFLNKRFDLLITDVVMPNMDGPTLCKKILAVQPDIKIIFISGYAEDTFRKNLGSDQKIHFLPKPFTLKQLAGKVKEVI